jgi:hypothetical protein
MKDLHDQYTSERESIALPQLSSRAQEPPPAIKLLPAKITPRVTSLSKEDHALLLYKERWLRTQTISIPKGGKSLQAAVEATLVFAQKEAGTAVCISAKGHLLTCSHCVAESVDDLDEDKSHWLLFAFGRVVEGKCVAWDSKRDLALLKIVAAQDLDGPSLNREDSMQPEFPFISPADSAPRLKAALGCIGHPGSEDLEASLPGAKTGYDVLHVSTGSFQGHAEGQDLQDNSEIGALKHGCWTYWGHSGAPLVDQQTGKLVGLHSSWDEETGMRRGVPLEAIWEFLENSDSLND